MEQNRKLERSRWELLAHLQGLLEKPLIGLSILWILLTVVDLGRGLTDAQRTAFHIVWGVFILDFAVRFFIAPDKLAFLKTNWLTAFSLLLPALRVVRIFRFARMLRTVRAGRSVNLARLITTANRGLKTTRTALGRRGVGAAIALTLTMALLGAAGIQTFEADSSGIRSFGDALWWTAMVMTTLGSDFTPQTAEGRLLTLFLAVYALGVLGYITGAIASYFVGKDSARAAGGVPATAEQVASLQRELRAVRRALADSARLPEESSPPQEPAPSPDTSPTPR